MERLRAWWDRWQSGRARHRLTALGNRVATLEGELRAMREAQAAERRDRAALDKALKLAVQVLSDRLRVEAGRGVERDAWVGALVELQQQNPARYRALRTLHVRRLAALQPATTDAAAAGGA